jgi:hypothetical protein
MTSVSGSTLVMSAAFEISVSHVVARFHDAQRRGRRTRP